MTNGYGAMPDYAAQLTPQDRWAVVAYIKALQLSQAATQAEVPAGQHAEALGDIAEREGLPASFANDWTLPPTSVTGTPDGQPFDLMAKPTGAKPATPAPMEKPASDAGATTKP